MATAGRFQNAGRPRGDGGPCRVTWCTMPGATTKRRVRWILGILALPLVYAASVALVVIFDGAHSGEHLWPVVVYLAAVIVAFVFAIGALGRTVREILLTVRMRRQERVFDDDAAVGGAGALAERLAAGEAPPGIEADGIDVGQGETIYLSCDAAVERLAAAGVHLPYTSGVFTEEPPEQEGPHWSVRQPARIAVSNDRLLIDVGAGWESIPYPQMTARYPLLRRQTFTADVEGAAPLRITGFAAPQIAVWVEFAIAGPAGVRELHRRAFEEPPQ